MATGSTGNPACAAGRTQHPCVQPSAILNLHWLLSLLLLFLASNSALAQKNAPIQPVNINSATIAQLETLPGIGATTAKSIIAFREKSGPFQRIEDLLAIKGISKAKLEKLRPYVTVAPPKPNQQSSGPHHASFSSSNFQEACKITRS